MLQSAAKYLYFANKPDEATKMNNCYRTIQAEIKRDKEVNEAVIFNLPQLFGINSINDIPQPAASSQRHYLNAEVTALYIGNENDPDNGSWWDAMVVGYNHTTMTYSIKYNVKSDSDISSSSTNSTSSSSSSSTSSSSSSSTSSSSSPSTSSTSNSSTSSTSNSSTSSSSNSSTSSSNSTSKSSKTRSTKSKPSSNNNNNNSNNNNNNNNNSNNNNNNNNGKQRKDPNKHVFHNIPENYLTIQLNCTCCIDALIRMFIFILPKINLRCDLSEHWVSITYEIYCKFIHYGTRGQ
ncbi:hypothetical protein SAMD00019534_000020 [Acytostelium subglobosum LB1]|uniref:hypothetical protein n=1 Tax=Acytostelium subglobosum LB1 TaxID=1410327 RepID=UPI0006452390|nr:hypothetical protein SAMD00019534_000020 [Acytostelium subglobosum LB1]GAM16827.1 hypothetical protein SAMD00019534_000020 [Acytostelium subglobosum LB1]|eukprot:XP_012758889.1 hypothetical protein SAMD00019534_000020 [Acytostelium subglobosum LB1]